MNDVIHKNKENYKITLHTFFISFITLYRLSYNDMSCSITLYYFRLFYFDTVYNGDNRKEYFMQISALVMNVD